MRSLVALILCCALAVCADGARLTFRIQRSNVARPVLAPPPTGDSVALSSSRALATPAETSTAFPHLHPCGAPEGGTLCSSRGHCVLGTNAHTVADAQCVCDFFWTGP